MLAGKANRPIVAPGYCGAISRTTETAAHWQDMIDSTSNPILDALSRVEIFKALNADQLQSIARHAERVMFRADEAIGTDGEAADGAILLIDGAVERQSGRAEPTSIAPGSLLAELAMFSEFTFGATFVARSSVKALRIEREHMLSLMNEDPAMAEAFVRIIAERLKSVATELSELDGNSDTAADASSSAAA